MIIVEGHIQIENEVVLALSPKLWRTCSELKYAIYIARKKRDVKPMRSPGFTSVRLALNALESRSLVESRSRSTNHKKRMLRGAHRPMEFRLVALGNKKRAQVRLALAS